MERGNKPPLMSSCFFGNFLSLFPSIERAKRGVECLYHVSVAFIPVIPEKGRCKITLSLSTTESVCFVFVSQEIYTINVGFSWIRNVTCTHNVVHL